MPTNPYNPNSPSSGDPSRFNPYNPGSPNYVPPAAPTPIPVDTTQQNLQEQMRRRLLMAHQQIGQQQNSAMTALRRRLAGAGALNSGGLALGTAQIGNQATTQRAQGANFAASGNVQGMDSFLGDLRNQDYQKWVQDQNYQNQRRLVLLQDQLQNDKPDNSWLSAFGGGLGSLAGVL